MPRLRLIVWRHLSSPLAVMATTLWLMLCAAGCGHFRGSVSPSVELTPKGNAILFQIPVGTKILVGTDLADSLHAAFMSESKPIPGGILLTKPIRIASEEYLELRDMTEMELYREIIRLRK